MATAAPRRPATGVADHVEPLLREFFPAGAPVRIRFWDGSCSGVEHSAGEVHVRSPAALRRILWAPGELGLGRAFVEGDVDLDGDVVALLAELEHAATGHRPGARGLVRAVRAAHRVGALGAPPPPPPEEARPRGRRHSLRRDRAAVRHHYDVGNDFYRLVLGPTMAYSCARFERPDSGLDEAQVSKFDLVCRKLGLDREPGLGLLDVGCGWGSLAIHAARAYGARVLGVTISPEQVELARRRVAEAGLEDLVEIRLQDYRELDEAPVDAVSSIGMFEHVGSSRMAEYFGVLHAHLRPGGRLLNHAISSVGGSRLGPRSFVGRYVFPDGELIDVGQVVLAMERAGLEVRDVESLREHYARTLRAWVGNLEANWSRASALVGERRARVWRLYMAASAVGFDDGGISVHQTLGVRPEPGGRSGMPPTRATMV
jgi:cyclopropane-fatty-acyl-phospholipid synthase